MACVQRRTQILVDVESGAVGQTAHPTVIPAQAGTHLRQNPQIRPAVWRRVLEMGPRLRGDDGYCWWETVQYTPGTNRFTRAA